MKKCNLSKIPARLLNECSFCNEKGLKPGILALEFRDDIQTQEHFSSMASEMEINNSGMCVRCENLCSSEK